MALCMQRAPITCQILDVVVYRLDQAIGRDASFPVKEKVFSKDGQLLKIGSNCCGAGFLAPALQFS
jgi:hypothetical protein